MLSKFFSSLLHFVNLESSTSYAIHLKESLLWPLFANPKPKDCANDCGRLSKKIQITASGLERFKNSSMTLCFCAAKI